MVLLNVEHIQKSYTDKPLLRDVSFVLEQGDKAGIVGVNGTGKSTLLKIIAGVEEPDAGRITRAGGLTVGYLPQNPAFDPSATVLEQGLSLIPSGQREEKAYLLKSILTRLRAGNLDARMGTLSGGQKRRVALAGALALGPGLLILDEPTNHIDAAMAAWLEDYLKSYKGALLMVTHDRYFLDRAAGRILELEGGGLTEYPAGYAGYLELKAQRQEMAAASQRKRQALIKRELEWLHQGPKARGTKSRYRIQRLEDMQAEAGPAEAGRLTMTAAASRLGKKIVELKGVSKAYGDKLLFDNFSYNLLRDDRIGIIGENGSGKSTLLKVLAGVLEPDRGEVDVGATVRVGYFSQEWEEMDPDQRPIDYIKNIAPEVQTGRERLTAAQMMESFLFDGDLQYSRIGRLSGGERRRLYLLGLLMAAPNILLLDEPTNDLDIRTLTILEDYLEGFPGAVVAVSHDRYFLDKTARHIFIMDGGRVRDSLGGYSDYLEDLQAEKAASGGGKAAGASDAAASKKAGAAEPSGTGKAEKAAGGNRRGKKERLRFSYKEQREFENIDGEIAALEESLQALAREVDEKASDYASLPGLLEKREALEAALGEKMDRWVYLNDLAERIAAGE